MVRHRCLLGPHDGGLLDVLGPDPCGPVGHSQEVLREKWVPLQGVDGAMMAAVGAHDLLGGRLGLAVARHHQTLLRPHHELGWLNKERVTNQNQ